LNRTGAASRAGLAWKRSGTTGGTLIGAQGEPEVLEVGGARGGRGLGHLTGGPLARELGAQSLNASQQLGQIGAILGWVGPFRAGS
jgi:hypothetical protein